MHLLILFMLCNIGFALDGSSTIKPVEATFDFYSLPDNPKVPKGQFVADVAFDKATGKLYGTVNRSGTKGFDFEVIHQIAAHQPSPWALTAVNQAVLESLIPLSLQMNYQEPISRIEFTQLIMAEAVDGIPPLFLDRAEIS